MIADSAVRVRVPRIPGKLNRLERMLSSVAVCVIFVTGVLSVNRGERTRAAAADRSSEVTRSALETLCLVVSGSAEPKRCEDPFAINGLASPT